MYIIRNGLAVIAVIPPTLLYAKLLTKLELWQNLLGKIKPWRGSKTNVKPIPQQKKRPTNSARYPGQTLAAKSQLDDAQLTGELK